MMIIMRSGSILNDHHYDEWLRIECCPHREKSAIILYSLSDERMSFLGATLGNLHIPSIGGIKKQISKVLRMYQSFD